VACRNVDEGETAASKMQDSGARAKFLEVDVSNEGSIEQFVEKLRIEYRTIDILVS
jgi:NAD(P)-dependent dehydrogenase (short-subunit alcohol dehydrogenase family)